MSPFIFRSYSRLNQPMTSLVELSWCENLNDTAIVHNCVWNTLSSFIIMYNNTGRDPDADTGGRWFESLFIVQQGAGKSSKRGNLEKNATRKKQEHGKTRWLTWQDKTNWQQTNREHRNKYPGNNGEDGGHLEVGGDNQKDRWNRSGHDSNCNCVQSWYSLSLVKHGLCGHPQECHD